MRPIRRDLAGEGLGALFESRRDKPLERFGDENRNPLRIGLGDNVINAGSNVDVARHHRECTRALLGDGRVFRLNFRGEIGLVVETEIVTPHPNDQNQ